MYCRPNLIAILFVFLVLGCGPMATSDTRIYKKSSATKKYSVVEISDFSKTDAEWIPYDSGEQIAGLVAEKLRKKDDFRVISRSSGHDSDDGFFNEDVLLIKGTVTGYDRGCKFCEWFFLGINDMGKSTISVWVELVDKNSGEILTDAGIDGRAKSPGFGETRYIRVADEIVKLVESVNGSSS